MPTCHEMHKGDIFICESCGLKIQVIEECDEVGSAVEDCCCHPQAEACTFSCCGKEMVRKTV